ncbi:MAG: 2OG-Fe(II) oxygenase [Gammaproteobacteria bacterium]|nr:2OG-Fe(II) oxygenase [Gammaproteobacteria bacterium]
MVIDDILPQHVVDALLDEYKNSNMWMNYGAGKTGGDSPATAILISHPKVIQGSPVRQKIHNEIVEYILHGFGQYHKKYSRIEQGTNLLMLKHLVGLRIIKYKKGQSLSKHTDKYTDPDTNSEFWPVVTFTINLNENYSGGELDLLDGAHIFKAKSGQCIFFPANFLYPHAINTVTRGIRYSLVGWFV